MYREPRKNPNVQLVAKDADDVFSVRSKPSVVTLLKEKACLLSTHGAVEVQHLFHPRGDGDDIEKAMQSRCSTLQGPLRSILEQDPPQGQQARQHSCLVARALAVDKQHMTDFGRHTATPSSLDARMPMRIKYEVLSYQI